MIGEEYFSFSFRIGGGGGVGCIMGDREEKLEVL